MEKQEKLLEFVRVVKDRAKGTDKDSYKGYTSVVERWVEEHGTEDEKEKIELLKTRQVGELILFRYKDTLQIMGIPERCENGESAYTEEGLLKRKYTDYSTIWGMHDGIQLGARSTIIDIKEMKVALSPYNKFFNMGEIEEITEKERERYKREGIYEIEATTESKVREKIKESDYLEVVNKFDGSMIQARNYKGNFVWSTSSLLMTEEEHTPEGTSMLDSVGRLIHQEPIKGMIKENPEKTFIFEYIGVKNRVVVDYEGIEEALVLIGITEMETLERYTYKEVEEFGKSRGVACVEVIQGKTLEDIKKDLRTKDAMDFEGYILNVVKGNKSRTYKVKADDYLEVHKLLDTTNIFPMIIRAVAEGMLDDIIPNVPKGVVGQVDAILGCIVDYKEKETKELERIVKEIEEKVETGDIEGSIKGKMTYITKEVEKRRRDPIRKIIKGMGIEEIDILKEGRQYKTPESLGITKEEQERILTIGGWNPKAIDTVVKGYEIQRIKKDTDMYIQDQENRYIQKDGYKTKDWDKEECKKEVQDIINKEVDAREMIKEIRRAVKEKLEGVYN